MSDAHQRINKLSLSGYYEIKPSALLRNPRKMLCSLKPASVGSVLYI